MREKINKFIFNFLTRRKYRVKLVKYGNGREVYYPQYRKLIWWNFYSYPYLTNFSSERRAWEEIRGAQIKLEDSVRRHLIVVKKFKYEE